MSPIGSDIFQQRIEIEGGAAAQILRMIAQERLRATAAGFGPVLSYVAELATDILGRGPTPGTPRRVTIHGNAPGRRCPARNLSPVRLALR